MTLQRRDDLEARKAVDIARMTKEGAGSLIYIGAVLGALILLLAVSMGFQTEWDASRGAGNSLSPQTVEVLAGLSEPVDLYPLYGKQNEVDREAYWRILRAYRRETDKLRVEFLDPQRQPGRLAELGVDPRGQDVGEGVTLVVRGDRRLSFRGMDEQDITNAILEIGRTGRRGVGFLRGFGEHDPESRAGGGYRDAREALSREYYDVYDVDLTGGIPAEVTVLIAAGPSLPIPPDDLATIQDWLVDGGRLLALLEPDDPSGLNGVLERWGLRAEGGIVLEPRSNINDSDQFVKAIDYTGHPIAEGFGARMPAAFPVVGRVADFETGENRLFHEAIVRSSGLSSVVGEDGVRAGGPFALGAASWLKSEDGERETRVVVYGDSDWASNAFLSAQANRNLFLNTVAWLARESQLITIRKNELEGQWIEFDAGERAVLGWILAAPPLALIVVGVVVAVRRRGR